LKEILAPKSPIFNLNSGIFQKLPWKG